MSSRVVLFIQAVILCALLFYILIGAYLEQVDFRVAALLWGAFFTICLQIWQTYIVQSAKINVEVISIHKKENHENIKIIISQYLEVSSLFDFYFNAPLFSDDEKEKNKSRIEYTLREINELIIKINDDIRFQEKRIQSINNAISEINSLTGNIETITNTEYEGIKTQLSMIGVSDKSIDKKDYLEAARKKLNDYHGAANMRRNKLMELIQKANSCIDNISNKQKYDNSSYRLTAAVINSGRLGTAIKSKALLRVFGANREVVLDLDLDMEDFSAQSAIKPNSTSIVYFTSAKINDLNVYDRNNHGIYWNGGYDCVLIISAINSKSYPSNAISFSDRTNSTSQIESLRECAKKIKIRV